MNRAIQAFMLILGVAALLIGCGAFSPAPVISSFTADPDTIDAGNSITFTVRGSTLNDLAEASTTDYSGTVTVSCSDLSYTKSANITGDFEEAFTATIDTAGAHTFTATLVASDGTTATKTTDVTVNQPGPWDTSSGITATTISYQDWDKGYFYSTTDELWFKYDGYTTSTYYIHYFEDDDDETSSMANVKLTAYEDDGTVLKTDTMTPTASFSPSNSSGIVYIKFEPESSSGDTGTFYFQIAGSSSPVTDGTITYNGGDSSYLSTGEVEVWYYDLQSSGYVEFQWEDSDSAYNADTAASYTADIQVTGFEGDDDLLFFGNDRCDSADEEAHYIASYNDIYVIVEGDYSTSYGSFYLDLDDH